jgi:hypothetical protein
MTTTTTATTLPPTTARLNNTFDAQRLLLDVRALQEKEWYLQRTIADDGSLTPSPVDWRCLALRSLGGDPDRTDPGGPGLLEFADTPWLEKAPYLAEVLRAIPGELRSARLMALAPGVTSAEHDDNKYGPAWGIARVHVPVITAEGALLYLEGIPYQWQPGEFWFGDFSRTHKVSNTGTETRIHLVVDTLVSEEMLAIFPNEHREQCAGRVLVNKPRVPLTPAELAAYRVTFAVPESFLGWEEPDGEFLRPQPTTDVHTEVVNGRLVLFAGDEALLGLVHVGDGEFRWAGWTDERTFTITRDGGQTAVTIRSRVGDAERSARLTARPR